MNSLEIKNLEILLKMLEIQNLIQGFPELRTSHVYTIN